MTLEAPSIDVGRTPDDRICTYRLPRRPASHVVATSSPATVVAPEEHLVPADTSIVPV